MSISEQELYKLSSAITADELIMLMELWTANNAAKIEFRQGVRFIDSFTKLLVIGKDNELQILKNHAYAAEAAGSEARKYAA